VHRRSPVCAVARLSVAPNQCRRSLSLFVFVFHSRNCVRSPARGTSLPFLGVALPPVLARPGITAVEAHLHRTRRLSDVISPRAKSLSAAPAVARWVRQTGWRTLLVGPDAESQAWIRPIAQAARCPWVVGHKQRLGDQRVEIRFPILPTTPRAVIVDDVASSGGTLSTAVRVLRRAGVPTVDAVVVHAIFAPGAQARIRRAGVRRLVSCDTIPHPTNEIHLAPLLAATKEFHVEESGE
jgi:ribose-phosphate pyrophosphokinase